MPETTRIEATRWCFFGLIEWLIVSDCLIGLMIISFFGRAVFVRRLGFMLRGRKVLLNVRWFTLQRFFFFHARDGCVHALSLLLLLLLLLLSHPRSTSKRGWVRASPEAVACTHVFAVECARSLYVFLHRLDDDKSLSRALSQSRAHAWLPASEEELLKEKERVDEIETRLKG